MTTHRYFATTAKNIEPLLLEELNSFGATHIKGTHLGVYFSGPLDVAYRACLWSRLAHHIFLELKTFEAPTREALYHAVKSIDWQKHFSLEQTFRIDVSGHHPKLTHPHFMAQIAKDAIVDQFRSRKGARPDIKADHPDIVLHVHVRDEHVSLYLDLSGESLHKRGLRTETGAAPLKETLACALLIRGGWPKHMKNPNAILFDPMCGAGTLLLEGAMMAYDIAPGLFRNYFGFTGWKQHQPATWKALTKDAETRHQEALVHTRVTFVGFDTNDRALKAAGENIKRLDLGEQILLVKRDATELDYPVLKQKQGLVISNPPYGKRLMAGENDAIRALYTAFGESAKQHLLGWQLAIFTAMPDDLKTFKMRPCKQYQFLNGALDCTLVTFEVDPKHFWRSLPQ